jgi:putative transposase
MRARGLDFAEDLTASRHPALRPLEGRSGPDPDRAGSGKASPASAVAQQKECQVVEGHLMPDHVHMLISIPPKYSVAQVIGYIKGKSAIHVARTFFDHKRNFVGQHFWARGYFVSTVGRDEATIREYIRNQEVEDKRQDQLKLQ